VVAVRRTIWFEHAFCASLAIDVEGITFATVLWKGICLPLYIRAAKVPAGIQQLRTFQNHFNHMLIVMVTCCGLGGLGEDK
tara:strand:+ start:80 stop:322 length:243 start_codon:yes stop_codon:yes gene_type:complete